MKFKVVGIGEVLWDLLPEGKQKGGAPANFACHASALGAQAHVISRVGADLLGRELIRQLESHGVITEGVGIDKTLPTGTVSVAVDARGEPCYTIHDPVAWDALTNDASALRVVAEADAICFGTLAQRHEPSRSEIRALVQAAPRSALRILDVNLRQQFFSEPLIAEALELANVLKLNATELPVLCRMFSLMGEERSQLAQLAERYRLRAIAYTRGGEGALVLADGKWSDHPGVPAKVQDTIGAGDSFTAAMALGLLAGWSAVEVNQRANEVAAHVASCRGATPALPESIRADFRDL